MSEIRERGGSVAVAPVSAALDAGRREWRALAPPDSTAPVSLQVALLQLQDPGASAEQSLAESVYWCGLAKSAGADIAVFPEMFASGYQYAAKGGHNGPWLPRHELAVAETGVFVERYARLAKALDMAIVVTYLQMWSGAPRNAATLIDRHGRRLLTYAKVHTCDWAAEAALTPGDSFPVAELDTRQGSARVGLLVCFDREIPEAAATLNLANPDVVLFPNACHLDDQHRIAQLAVRAFEGAVGVAVANYADAVIGSDRLHCNGNSAAFDGVCFRPDGTPIDNTIARAGSSPGITLAPFDISALRAYRSHTIWGSRHRKPQTYTALTDLSPAERARSEPTALGRLARFRSLHRGTSTHRS